LQVEGGEEEEEDAEMLEMLAMLESAKQELDTTRQENL
jgi:hypothetical protein